MFDWTDERVELLKDRWVTYGDSAKEIAARIGAGITRNAVLGKLGRLKLLGTRRAPRPCLQPRKPRTVRSSVPAHARMPVNFARSSTREQAQPPRPQVDVPPSLNRRLLELGRIDETGPMHCRFPTSTEAGEHRFCGNDTDVGPWCAAHQQLVWAPREARGQRRAA